MPDGYFHCCITSPPYWGQRDYGVAGQLGLEKTPEEHIAKLVEGFRQVRRVLRDDGVLFVNYGDKYNGSHGTGGGPGDKQWTNVGSRREPRNCNKLQQGDLLCLAWRLGLALQRDGWILRSDIVWAKAVSFCDKYSGSTMPESVSGCRWERCRVKVKSFWNKDNPPPSKRGNSEWAASHIPQSKKAQFKDCPGCAKCEPNDGLVLRYGSWRPTRAHEYLLMLVKGPRYFCDIEAVREAHSPDGRKATTAPRGNASHSNYAGADGHERWPNAGRNLRDVWTINPKPYPDAHYATFPPDLVIPCIKAATSSKGCCGKCGAQWAPVVEKEQVKRKRPADRTDRHNAGDGVNSCGNTVAGVRAKTLGFRPTCSCGETETVPCRVLDPFCGSGTTLAEAARLGRGYIGIEINPDYIERQATPRVAQGETGITVKEQKRGQGGLFE